MRFAIVNEAKDAAVDSVLLDIAAALVKQAAQDYASFHETLPSEVSIFEKLEDVDSLHCAFLIVDEIPEAPGALAYHTVTAWGRPMLKLGWETIKKAGGKLTTGANSLSAAMSHEVLETIGDPYVCCWSDFSAWQEVAYEVCDPVQGDTYEIDGIAVSNFVGPRWFALGGPGPYDMMGKLSEPLTMSPGGYMVLREGGPGGTQKEVFGDKVPEEKQALIRLYGRRAADQSP